MYTHTKIESKTTTTLVHVYYGQDLKISNACHWYMLAYVVLGLGYTLGLGTPTLI